MTDVDPTVADGTDPVEDAPKVELTREQLEKELAKVRREAASNRVEKNAQKALVDELQKYRDSEKTELELLKERAERAEAVAKEVGREKAARDAAKKAGLDPDLFDLLKGDTDEELEQHAAALKERLGATPKAGNDLLGGSRGAPVKANSSNNEQFRTWFSNGGKEVETSIR